MTGFWKVLGAATLVAVTALGLAALLAWPQVSGHADAALRRRVVAEAQIFAAWAAPELRTPEPAVGGALQERVAALARLLPLSRLTLIAADGRVLADSEERPEVMENHADRPEVLAAGLPGTVPIERHSRTIGRPFLYFAVPVTGPDGTRAGTARVSVSLDEVDADRAELRRALLLALAGGLAVSALLAALLTRSAQEPIRAIGAYVAAISRGERAAPLGARRFGDLRPLAESIETMAARLEQRFLRIERDRSEIRSILASMVEGVLAIDAEQRVMLLNASAGRMLGLDEATARGKPIWELTRIPEVADLLARCLRTNRLAAGEALLAGQPHDRVLRLTASPLGDGEGAWGALLVLDDLTGLRHLETVRRDFVVNVSHELKTPLTAMRGFLEAVLDDAGLDDATRRRFLLKVRDNTDRMVAIVTDLLTLARLEAEETGPHLAPLDLREVASEAADDGSGAAAMRGISIVLDLPGTEVPVLGERESLVTAVGNLVDNAVKYGPRGSRVRVRAVLGDGEAVLEVADSGPGIPAHERERIFERFYRVDKARSRELGGTGLGLSIVRHVAQLHGGSVGVESRPGEGSTFRIRLPLRKPAAAPV